MTITENQKYIIAGVLVLTAFATGRYTVQKPNVKTIDTSKTETQVNQDKNTHTVVTVVESKEPTGASKTVTTTDTTTDLKTVRNTDTTTKDATTVTQPKIGTLHVAALVANDFSRGILVPTYGASISKEVLGPVTVGAFGLSNGVIGLSLGLDF